MAAAGRSQDLQQPWVTGLPFNDQLALHVCHHHRKSGVPCKGQSSSELPLQIHMQFPHTGFPFPESRISKQGLGCKVSVQPEPLAPTLACDLCPAAITSERPQGPAQHPQSTGGAEPQCGGRAARKLHQHAEPRPGPSPRSFMSPCYIKTHKGNSKHHAPPPAVTNAKFLAAAQAYFSAT